MKLKTKIVWGMLCVLCVLGALCGLSALSGCSDAQYQAWIKTRDTAQEELTAAGAEVAALKAEAAALPEGKVKQTALKVLAQSEGRIPSLQKKVDDASTLAAGIHSGDAAQATAGAAGLLSGTALGPYAGLAITLAGYIYERLKRKSQVAEATQLASDATAEASEHLTNLKNVVFSIEHGGPEWTADHASEIAALQGPATTAAVNAIKQEIGIIPVPSGAGDQEQK